MNQALVIPTSTLLKISTKPLTRFPEVVMVRDELQILEAQWSLQDRRVCETDPNYLQILPYITIKDYEGSILSYRRGSASAESRLLKKCSIGFGGHVEETLSNIETDLISKRASLLTLHTMRELNEELGLAFSYGLYKTIYSNLRYGDFYVIYSTESEVDRVHLCLHMDVYVNPYDLVKMEKDVINDTLWASAEELKDKHEDGSRVLEGWSKILLYEELV